MREMQRCVKINRSHTHILYIYIYRERERQRSSMIKHCMVCVFINFLTASLFHLSFYPWDSSDIIRHRDSPTVKAKKSRPTTAKTYQGPSPRYSPGFDIGELLRDGY